ncbi:hypothetical protein KXX35_003288, partial [Aspergillus fumigatus]
KADSPDALDRSEKGRQAAVILERVFGPRCIPGGILNVQNIKKEKYGYITPTSEGARKWPFVDAHFHRVRLALILAPFAGDAMSRLSEVEALVNDDFFLGLFLFSLPPSAAFDCVKQSLMFLRLVEIPDSETGWCPVISKNTGPRMDRSLLAQPQ